MQEDHCNIANYSGYRVLIRIKLMVIPSIALRTSNARDFRVICAPISAQARTKRKRSPSN